MDRELFEKLSLESNSSELSSLVTLATPGVSADSNGLFHGLGDHASNSFSIDGQPITDQQSKVFSNQLPVEAVQSMQVIEGAPPADFGGKASLVNVATNRSGLGVTTRTAMSRPLTALSALPPRASIFPTYRKDTKQACGRNLPTKATAHKFIAFACVLPEQPAIGPHFCCPA